MSGLALVVYALAGWVVDPPNPGSGELPPGEVGDKVLLMLRWVAGLASAACVGGLLFTAGRMALAWRRGDHADIAHLGLVFFACVVIGSAAAIVTALL